MSENADLSGEAFDADGNPVPCEVLEGGSSEENGTRIGGFETPDDAVPVDLVV